MDPRYMPKTHEGRLDHLIEEMGEVMVAIGKMRRFGPYNQDPRLPPRALPNWRQLQIELRDLYKAASLVENDLHDMFGRASTVLPSPDKPEAER